jgi:hypothetical protein
MLNNWRLFIVNKHIVTRSSDYRGGFGLDTGFIDCFNTRLVTSINYSVIANFRTL